MCASPCDSCRQVRTDHPLPRGCDAPAQADHVRHRAAEVGPGDWDGADSGSPARARADRPPCRRTPAVGRAGIRAPVDAAAPAAQQHVRDLDQGELVTRYDERLLRAPSCRSCTPPVRARSPSRSTACGSGARWASRSTSLRCSPSTRASTSTGSSSLRDPARASKGRQPSPPRRRPTPPPTACGSPSPWPRSTASPHPQDHRPRRSLGHAVPGRWASRSGYRRHRQPAGVHRHRDRQGSPVAAPGSRRGL